MDRLTVVRAGAEGESVEAAARRVAPIFSGVHLTALRELRGETQAGTAAAAGITASALSQAERGITALSASNIAKIAEHFGVSPDALAERREPRVEMEPQFRHLRRTPARDRRQADRFIRAAARVASALREQVEFPEPFSLTCPIDPERPIDDVAEEVEHAAALARLELGLPKYKPITHRLIGSFEAGGITVVRDPEAGSDIDAFSAVVGQLPVVVLYGGEDAVWDRDNFNLAHELGHIVMHRGIDHTPGTRSIEAQAHRFAGAFLGPSKKLREELPRDLDWARYFELKRRWGMSMAALVRRAKDLRVIDDDTYTRAMKQQSAHGWRRIEPGVNDRPLPTPLYLGRAKSLADMTQSELATATHLPKDVVRRIVGPKRPKLID